MNLDNNALLKSAGIGAGVELVLALLTLVLAATVPIIGVACCCLIWIIYAGTGALYGVFARQNGATVEPGPLALGGGIAAAVAGTIAGLVNGIGSFVRLQSGATLQQLLQAYQQMGIDVPPQVYQMYSGAGFGLAAAAIGICFSIFIGAILGAIGGAIYGATQRNSAPPPAPAAM